jgi:hypothetical protein
VPWTGWREVAGQIPSGLPPGAPVMALARYPSGKALDVWMTANDGRIYTAYYIDDGMPWTGWYPVEPRRP